MVKIMIELSVRATIHPTEDEDLVKKAFLNIFPFENFETTEINAKNEYQLKAHASGPEALQFFFIQVRQQRVVQAFHNHVSDLADLKQNEVTFMINKQFLTQKHVALCSEPQESPLGPVYITIRAANIMYVINYLFPETESGKVLEVHYKPHE
jgi:predicted RNA binding protein with dsRBD fold (UPF0201 family)